MTSTTDTLKPFRVSNDALQDGETLRARMQQEGYLFFQGLLPASEVLATRREVLTLCTEAGWLAPGTDLMEGIAAPSVTWIEPQPAYMEVYNRLMCNETFHTFALSPPLMQMLATLFGEPVLAHPRNIARIVFPQNTLHTTPAHQDYIHVQGTEETYTAWIPLGDCPTSLGSLIILEGSHTGEIFPVRSAYGAGGVGIETDSMEFSWVGGDFALGDLVVFHSLTVHKALPNLSPDRLRLSTDFRYQPLSHPVDASSLLPHFAQVTWDEVYAGWKSDRHQYYWQSLPIRLAERDPRVHAVRSSAAERR